MGALLGLAQPVPRAPHDDADLVVDPVSDERVERQRPRNPVDERQHVRAERVLQLGVLVQVVENDLRDGRRRGSMMTSRWPVRPLDSSRMSAMPWTWPSLCRSAIFCARLSGLTWYGNSVMTSCVRPRLSSSISTTARMVIMPRPVRYASSMPRRRRPAHRSESGPGMRCISSASSFLARRLGVLEVPLHPGGDLAQGVVRRHVRRHPDGDAEPLTSRSGSGSAR